MHAIGPRVNVFFTHLMTMTFVLVAIGSSFSYMQLRKSSPIVDLRMSEMSFLRQLQREKCDQAYIKFDLDADFRKMWSWNINHMYVYVVAEYQSSTHTRNEVVVWDSILSGRQDALIARKGQYNKYSLKDHGYGLRNTPVTLKFKYNILPYMGPLFYGEEGQTSFNVPANYTSRSVSFA
ncbi:Signal peptidase complex subunit 3 [Gracilariopsis chorda]|uniref:Signal peptidase complex subunit 3 n=1 Tax=Gracilariopsis chorda TaxID=448386 RepID=A0A2V3J0Z0_9FLOR|nr:Signal peptidase complex subunit 3 [Gracilariopsis chorda]|eukprot:PXF47607.1 Signal peptidase complex subunit 3 [Gracilariopsis chorda]